jgi:predicted DNA-binding transcriptional regulator AlpA
MANWTDFLDPNEPDGAYLPWKKVEPRVGISRTTAWRLQKCGDFPKPYVVSPGRVAYRESEVEAWKASRGHRSAATIRSAPVTSAITGDTAEALPPPAELPSWSPSPATSSPKPAAMESAPREPEARPRGSRRSSRRSHEDTAGDQMEFEF